VNCAAHILDVYPIQRSPTCPPPKYFDQAALRLCAPPRRFVFSTSEVAIFRHDDELALLEKRPSLVEVLDPLPPWADDVTPKATRT
jgi:hypothetical protein